MRVGILALQGGFAAHAKTLEALGHEPVLVREAQQLEDVDGLVLPGGESTTMLKLIGSEGLDGPLDAFVRSDKPVLATCAGLILAARSVTGPSQQSFGWLDIHVARNAWGRQVDSFEATSDPPEPRHLMFIRAPRIVELGTGCEVLTRLDGEPVAIRQGKIIGAAFHPELTDEGWLHALAFGPGARDQIAG